MPSLIPPKVIEQTAEALKGEVVRTPVLMSAALNQFLGHEVFFKCESFQEVGAFKARGALNFFKNTLREHGKPSHVVATSSGNHAQAVAWAAKKFGVKATILMGANVSELKHRATESYGAEVIICKDRFEADSRAKDFIEKGLPYIPPYDHDWIIAGQGTAALEALQDMAVLPNAIFAPCGGGGLLSGTFLAAQNFSDKIKIFGGEPLLANDAACSLKKGEIVGLAGPSSTLADGARTPAVSERTFLYLQKISGIYEVSEEDIIYWTQWLTHLLKITLEPTAVLGMAAATQYLKTVSHPQKVLVLLSGGNLDIKTRQAIWAKDFLNQQPHL